MFNEKDSKWIKIYKNITIIIFVIFIIIGTTIGYGDYSGEFFDVDLGGDTLLDYIFWILIFSTIGFMQLTFNMLIIQLLNNVQIIREKMESITENYTEEN